MQDEEKQTEILHEIRRVAQALESQPLTQKAFKRLSRIPEQRVRYYFGTWNKAVVAAGILPNPSGHRVSGYQSLTEDELLKAIGDVWKSVGRRPTEALMNSEGAYTVKPYRVRWGNFRKAIDEYVKRYGEPSTDNAGRSTPQTVIGSTGALVRPARLPITLKPTVPASKKPIIYGEPLDFRGLRYAPVNEQGVVYLFGMISREMGFLIESIRTDFPDCEGKRALDAAGTKWQHVRIEFEYRSRNFAEHGHDPDGCDLIVCWIHDWPECPVEVLELKINVGLLPGK